VVNSGGHDWAPCALGEAGADGAPAPCEVIGQLVVDIGAAALAADHPGLAQHLEVMADGGLADSAAIGEVAGADAASRRPELADDGEANGVSNGLEELDV